MELERDVVRLLVTVCEALLAVVIDVVEVAVSVAVVEDESEKLRVEDTLVVAVRDREAEKDLVELDETVSEMESVTENVSVIDITECELEGLTV
jgi:hypothetical protein